MDVLFPPLCLSCSELLEIRTDFICPSCLSRISRIDRTDHQFTSIRTSFQEEGLVQEVVAPYWFNKGSPLQSIIHALKYQQIPQVGIFLGELVGKELLRTGRHVDHLIPIPLHNAKQREREYNQAEYIARGVASACGAPIRTDLVRRTVNTRTQTELTSKERRHNVDGAFELQGRMDLDGTVLVVDDVITTGATIRAVAALLKQAGCRTVVAGSIALAALHSDIPESGS